MSSEALDQPLQPRKQSLLRSSVLMASGTLVSRVLGFVRSALLIAALGAVGSAADAFELSNTLPNSVYNLLAAGVLDAILVPQIIRALKRKGGSAYLNKLITLAGTILFGITMLTMVAAPLLVSIMGASEEGPTRALAITFALWCLPQLFFYGVYNLLGEVLNARGIFGPYMWAPVVNNVVGIAGLAAFLFMWGPSGGSIAAEDITSDQILVIAGTATLGVILQALCLFIPMAGSGVKLRLDFRFRGTDFGSASKVAGWTFATLLVSQLGVISTSNLALAATRWSGISGVPVASLRAYTLAFTIYMVPQSLIAVTLATAIFTRLANNASAGELRAVARDYHSGVKLITMLSMLSVGILVVAAIPIMQLVMPNLGDEGASIFAPVLVALVLGIPSTGIVMISQRVFFAFEDAKPVFLMGIVPTALQLIVGWTIYFTAGAEWWTVGAAAAETVCRVTQGFIAIFWTARRVSFVNPGKLIAAYLLYFMAFVVSAAVGWLALRVVSPYSGAETTLGVFFGSAWRLIFATVVVTAVFVLVLRVLDPNGTKEVAAMIRARFKRNPPDKDAGSGDQTKTAAQTGSGEEANAGSADAGDSSEAEQSSLSAGPIGGASWGASLSGAYTPPPSWEEIPEFPQISASTTRPISDDAGADEYHAEEIATPSGPKGELVSQQPSKRSNRFNPAPLSLALAAIAVIIGIVYAFSVLSDPVENKLLESLQQDEQTAQSEPQSEEATPPPPPAAPGAPTITSVEVFSWGNDGLDHPELAGTLIDGDPNTIWYTRYYDWNQFEEDNTISLLVTFEQESRVNEVALSFLGGSGEGEITIREPVDGNPRAGNVIATAPITENTVIKLPPETDLSSLGINFVRLPVDDEGLQRAKVTGLTIN